MPEPNEVAIALSEHRIYVSTLVAVRRNVHETHSRLIQLGKGDSLRWSEKFHCYVFADDAFYEYAKTQEPHA